MSHFIDNVFATVTVVVSFANTHCFLASKNSGGGDAPPPASGLLQLYNS